MLRALIRFSVGHVQVVIALALMVVGFAIHRLPRMSVDVFPELNSPTITIMSEARGLSADEVEQLVTFPIETAVSGAPHVQRIRSSSAIGLSIVFVDLEWGADLLDARQLVGERLASARSSLPPDVESFMTPITSVAGEIMLVSLSSPDGAATPMELREFAEFRLRRDILAVPGVAQVSVIGGALPEYQVHVDPTELRRYGLAVADVVDAAAEAHSTESAGYLPSVGPLEIPLRQEARVRSVEDLAAVQVTLDGDLPITIGDVAEVGLGPALRRGSGSEGGSPAIVLSIQKSPGRNTLALTDAIDALFDRVEPTLPAGMVLNRDVVRQSHFIERSIENVRSVLLEAILIVVLVVALFLLNVRTTLITLAALPISLAVGLLGLDALGLGLNVMTLGGLAVAIGVLVDDAIIDVENVFRRLREARATKSDESRTAIIERASNEIRPAMVFATAIIVMVFVPLLFLQGIEGRFFRPLALTYMVSIGASLIVALTVTPALCELLLRGRLGSEKHTEGVVVRALKAVYRPLLAGVLRLRWLVVAAAVAASAVALLVGARFGTAFLPSFNEGTFTVFVFAPPGTSLEESDRVARQVELEVSSFPGVAAVVRRTGRAERDEHAEPVSSSEMDVRLEPDADAKAVRQRIEYALEAVPGLTTMIGQPIEHRLSHLLSGTPAAIAINVFGDDLDALRAAAKAIEAELRTVPGAIDINAQREVMITSLPVRFRHTDLARAGLRPAEAARQVSAAIAGETVATVNEGARVTDVVVRLDPDLRRDVDDVAALELRGSNGALVRLDEVADLGLERSSNLITRENARRKAVVSLNVVEGASLTDVVAEIDRRIAPILDARGLTATYGGQFEAQAAAARTIAVSGALVALAMLLMLEIVTGTLRSSLVVMLNLPLALIGGIVAILLSSPGTDGLWALLTDTATRPPVLSIASVIGFITLFGVAVRGGVLLINHVRELEVGDGLPPREALVRGALERLAPILMTALSAALGLIPLALAAGEPGAELLAPLAIVTLGGLVSSTLLNLLVLPAAYAIAFRLPRR